MSKQNFLFTYSVSPTENVTERKKELADKVRDNIAKINIDGWTKSTIVETTFWGTIEVTGSSYEERGKSAAKVVKSAIETVYRDCKATKEDVVVRYEMLLNSSDKSFSFNQ